MLQIKDLTKVYKTPSGEIRALDGVSIDFPETGMVFLLGRSGSGKSTLLNVAGGLDTPTSGEIIVEGRSSKDFTLSDFDGYRNSFIGFVFQEFNVLNEFTIEQNIALALQLQHKPNSPEMVNQLLKEVGLDGVGKRKPNTLSGGQKQRIAIARALIKNPKIIMADEPTGALDSNTGEQIFEMLKNLAKTRLVVVVTHDRTFAENYADRIIELGDGKIISDVTVTEEKVIVSQDNVTFVGDDTVKVADWNKVTEDDVKKIVEVMKKKGGETVITTSTEAKEQIQKVRNISTEKVKKRFEKTKKQPQMVASDKDVKFIKAKLPFKNATKMAFDGLKSKPLRLVFTIFLSMIAFIFFGVSSAFMRFSPEYVIATALEGSDYTSIALEKKYEATFTTVEYNNTGSVEKQMSKTLQSGFSKADLEELNKNEQGLDFAGIIDLGWYKNDLDSIEGYQEGTSYYLSVDVAPHLKSYYPVKTLCGFSDCGHDYLVRNGMERVAGRYPTAYNEIAVSKYVFDLFDTSPSMIRDIQEDENKTLAVDGTAFETPNDFINRWIDVGNMKLWVTGVYDTGKIPERFNILKDGNISLDKYQTEKLTNELKDILEFSFSSLGFVSEEFYQHYKDVNNRIDERTTQGVKIDTEPILQPINATYTMSTFTPKSIWEKTNLIQCYDFNGNEISPDIKENQVMLPAESFILGKNTYSYYFNKAIDDLSAEEKEKYSEFRLALKDYRVDQQYRKLVIETILRDYEKVVGEPLNLPTNVYTINYKNDVSTLEVVGVYIAYKGPTRETTNYYVHDSFLDKNQTPSRSEANVETRNIKLTSNYKVDPINDRYAQVITPTSNTREQTYFMLEGGGDYAWFEMQNDFYEEANVIASTMADMKLAFYIAGAIFGVFAILMLFNFISVTINSKRKEIGILRAIGARKVDVFKIFIVEALIITLSCFVISAGLSAVACNIINKAIMSMAEVSLSALNYGFFSVSVLFVSSIIVALLATAFPVRKEAKKSPVDSIRCL
ncbi:MAG: ABC transporter ATP-binding protein/permease [Clostridia bacterium]|nr:ABC transporter ATP-binding protein/permease [Clostridia bacterium]